jgi:enoyl-CoA hydratase/carnithine racemase
MGFDNLIFREIEPGIGLITLNRPDRLNALSLNLLDDLHRLYDDLEDSPAIRGVILTGAGRGFCSGADLKDERSKAEAEKHRQNAATHLLPEKKLADRIEGNSGDQ